MHCSTALVAGLLQTATRSLPCARLAGEWLDGMTAKIPRNDAPEEIEARRAGHALHICVKSKSRSPRVL